MSRILVSVRILVVRILVALWILAAAGAAAEPTPPNVLLIVVDDLGYGELGCQGNPEIPTPHIDSLARQGVRCTAAYVTASYCSPSRAGLMTGRYQTRFGHELNPTGKHNLHPQAGIPRTERTLADHLRQGGYATGLIGKWHLGDGPAFHPQRRGFDEFYGFLHEGHFFRPPPYPGLVSFLRRKKLPLSATAPGETTTRFSEGSVTWTSHLGRDEPPYDLDNPIRRGTRAIVEPRYLTDAFTDEGVAFIKQHQRQPFFLMLSYNTVHSPMQARREDLDQFSHITDLHRRVFAGMLANLDTGIGRLLHTLRELDLEQRTLIFFLSDNGGPTKELTSSNQPLRGGKGSMYEGGLRVPFLVKWPRKLPAGREYRQAVLATDIFATCLAAAGLSAPAERAMDGSNLLPFLRGKSSGPPHPVLYWRMGNKYALRDGPWKIVGNHSRQNVELYNLQKDLGETTDLSEESPSIRERLRKVWQRLDAEMVKPNWTRT